MNSSPHLSKTNTLSEDETIDYAVKAWNHVKVLNKQPDFRQKDYEFQLGVFMDYHKSFYESFPIVSKYMLEGKFTKRAFKRFLVRMRMDGDKKYKEALNQYNMTPQEAEKAYKRKMKQKAKNKRKRANKAAQKDKPKVIEQPKELTPKQIKQKEKKMIKKYEKRRSVMEEKKEEYKKMKAEQNDDWCKNRAFYVQYLYEDYTKDTHNLENSRKLWETTYKKLLDETKPLVEQRDKIEEKIDNDYQKYQKELTNELIERILSGHETQQLPPDLEKELIAEMERMAKQVESEEKKETST